MRSRQISSVKMSFRNHGGWECFKAKGTSKTCCKKIIKASLKKLVFWQVDNKHNTNYHTKIRDYHSFWQNIFMHHLIFIFQQNRQKHCSCATWSLCFTVAVVLNYSANAISNNLSDFAVFLVLSIDTQKKTWICWNDLNRENLCGQKWNLTLLESQDTLMF